MISNSKYDTIEKTPFIKEKAKKEKVMKLKHIVKWISILLTCMLCWNCFPKTIFFTEALTEQSTQKDSGIDYTESIKTIQNPGMGYTTNVNQMIHRFMIELEAWF